MSTITTSTNITTTAVAETEFVEAQASQIFRILVFALTIFASLLGNAVVCKAVFEIRSSKPLSYLLVTNLAAAEIINTLCLPFIFVYQYHLHWSFGEFGCRIFYPVQVASMFVVTNTLAAIAVYRYHFIDEPSFARPSSRTVKIMLFLLWAFPFLFCLPLFVYHTQFVYRGDTHCLAIFPGDDVVNQKYEEISKAYNIARFTFNFIVPCLIMVLSYAGVAWKLRRFVRRTREASIEITQVLQDPGLVQNSSTDETSPTFEEITTNPQDANHEEELRRGSARVIELEHDLIRVFFMVIIIFLVFYMPYQLLFMYAHFAGAMPNDYIYLYLNLLSNLPSALHPLCYGTMSSFYAMSFSKLVLCKTHN